MPEILQSEVGSEEILNSCHQGSYYLVTQIIVQREPWICSYCHLSSLQPSGKQVTRCCSTRHLSSTLKVAWQLSSSSQTFASSDCYPAIRDPTSRTFYQTFWTCCSWVFISPSPASWSWVCCTSSYPKVTRPSSYLREACTSNAHNH